MESADIENDDDISSSDNVEQTDSQISSHKTQENDELEVFREEWREELKRKQQPQSSSVEEEAVSLYWMGAAAERSGDMHAALLFYKKACHLVPDIDFKLNKEQPPQSSDSEDSGDEDGPSGYERGSRELVEQFQTLSIQGPHWCTPARSTKSVHISSLPLDVVRCIVQWVVSAQLDMRSLEIVSMTCRALYCLAREPHLWRMACRRVWRDVSSASSYGDSWRRMFILKPHLQFNGVYISKNSYVRQGERSLDTFYRPYHTVVYYRFLRFLPDGSVMYQNTPENPMVSVSRLCHKHSRDESVLLGEYTHTGSKVVVEVVSQATGGSPQRQRGRGKGKRQGSSYDRKFHLELSLSSSSSRQRCNQLSWREYSCQSLHKPTGHAQTSHFNLDYTYTPFYFSRVKSYSTNSTGMLT
ncbi:F-box only protein 9-like isoform X2 [Halichondria panicea]|uniref:F-box only protein 9-like isoform X2 n=1 Tax=Halichondria panicea TaxID=6063 RepID=UPI00312B380D